MLVNGSGGALNGTGLLGAYMTDIIKDFEQSIGQDDGVSSKE